MGAFLFHLEKISSYDAARTEQQYTSILKEFVKALERDFSLILLYYLYVRY